MVVVNGQCKTAGNMVNDWIGVQIDEHFEAICTNSQFYVANDVDLAGIAKMQIGAGRAVIPI